MQQSSFSLGIYLQDFPFPIDDVLRAPAPASLIAARAATTVRPQPVFDPFADSTGTTEVIAPEARLECDELLSDVDESGYLSTLSEGKPQKGEKSKLAATANLPSHARSQEPGRSLEKDCASARSSYFPLKAPPINSFMAPPHSGKENNAFGPEAKTATAILPHKFYARRSQEPGRRQELPSNARSQEPGRSLEKDCASARSSYFPLKAPPPHSGKENNAPGPEAKKRRPAKDEERLNGQIDETIKRLERRQLADQARRPTVIKIRAKEDRPANNLQELSDRFDLVRNTLQREYP